MRASTRASMRASTRGRARACRRTPTGTCTRATSRTSRWRDSEYTFTEGARTRATRRSSSARGRQPSRARGRRAQEEGGQVGFEVSFPSGRARATFEILRILKQTRILGSFVNLLKRAEERSYSQVRAAASDLWVRHVPERSASPGTTHDHLRPRRQVAHTGAKEGAAALQVRAYYTNCYGPPRVRCALVSYAYPLINTCLPRAGRQTVTDVVR